MYKNKLTIQSKTINDNAGSQCYKTSAGIQGIMLGLFPLGLSNILCIRLVQS